MKFDKMMRDVRREQEQVRVDAVKASGSVPDVCGDAIPDAPARGPVRVFEVQAMCSDGVGGWERQPVGYRGRKTMQLADAFDVMEAKAQRRLFSVGQKAIGRRYRDLVERHSAAGVKCSSIEAMGGGSGSGGDFMDVVLLCGEEIDLLRRQIGAGVAKELRVLRPSVRGSRISIMDRRLVDAVCIEGLTLSDVLRSHGWSVHGEIRVALRSALGNALDRMNENVRGSQVRSAHF